MIDSGLRIDYSNEAEFGQQAMKNSVSAVVDRREHPIVMVAFTGGYYLLDSAYDSGR